MEAVPELKVDQDISNIIFSCPTMGFTCCFPVTRDVKMKYKTWIRERLLPPSTPSIDFVDIQYEKYKVNLGIYWQSKTCILEFRSNGSNVKTVLHIKEHFQNLINIFSLVFV